MGDENFPDPASVMTGDEPIRIAHFGLGAIGRAIAAATSRRPEFKSVLMIDSARELVGRDAATVPGLEMFEGMIIQGNVSDGALVNVDAVLHATSSSLHVVAPELEACLSGGCHVVSTCEELAYPFDAVPEVAARLDFQARAAGVCVVGAGANPGFVMDALPTFLSAAATDIDRVQVTRVVDTRRRRSQLRAKTGVGLTEEEFAAGVTNLSIRHVGLRESALIIAAALRWTIESVQETVVPIIAQRTIRLPGGTVRAGSVAGIRQTLVASSGGGREVVLDLTMSVGAPRPRDEIEILGNPIIRALIPGGVHGDAATAALVVSTAAKIGMARPGLRSPIDFPVSGSGTSRTVAVGHDGKTTVPA